MSQTRRPKNFIVTLPTQISAHLTVQYIEILLREQEAALAKKRLHVCERELGYSLVIVAGSRQPRFSQRIKTLFPYGASWQRSGSISRREGNGG